MYAQNKNNIPWPLGIGTIVFKILSRLYPFNPVEMQAQNKSIPWFAGIEIGTILLL